MNLYRSSIADEKSLPHKIIQNMATFVMFSYLVLSLCILSVSANSSFFLSIDCGSSASYEDENSIAWVGDDNYVKTGESHTVRSAKYSVSHVMDTMRVFTTRKKNCYHIDSVKQGNRVLVRASFLYGDYDNKSSAPVVGLLIDGNFWALVQTSMSEVVYHEVIYVTQRDSISVCVSSYSGLPFISALEVRSLTLSMYPYQYLNDGESYPLFLQRRVAFGSNQPIRYPTDPYDRIWTSGNNYTSLNPVSNIANNLSNLVKKGEEPPPAVLKNGVTVKLPNDGITISVGMYFPVESKAYYIAYFSEVTQLKSNEKRSFTIYSDSRPHSLPIIPPYGDYIEQYSEYITFSKESNIYIRPTDDSTLPPLINALEIFSVGKPLINGTHDKDVEGLAILQKAFPGLQTWTGDPCLPSDGYAWEWVGCNSYNYHPRPRVTSLNLGGYGLSGAIPDFSSMDALQTIDLSNNSLKGPLPDFLARLPNIWALHVDYNPELNGAIPASLVHKISDKGTNLCVQGINCPRPSCSRNMYNNYVMTIFFGSIIPSIIIYMYLVLV